MSVALVLGASRGIGAEIARVLAARDMTVVAAARSADDLATVVDGITAAGGQAEAAVCDAGDPAATAALVEDVVARHGGLRAAVNNAAANLPPAPFADVDPDAFAATLTANVTGTFAAMRAEVAAMRAAGGGAIVTVASTAGLRAVPGLAAYVASKHALVGLTRAAALDHAADGVRVNAIAPGPIATERLAGLPEAAQEQITASVPMGRMGSMTEIAELTAWLLSDAASFITGAVLTADGGRTAGGA